MVAAAVTVGLTITGIAWAAQDSGSTVNVSLAENQTVELPANDAGVVVLSRTAGQLQIVTATPNPGFSAEVEVAAGREVEADFRGNGERVQFNAELEDGVVRIRIRVEAASGATSSTVSTSAVGQTSSTGSTSTTNSTSTTATANGSGTLVLANGQVSDVTVNDAGSVLLRRDGSSLTVVSTEANPGWVVEVEVGTGREVEGDFRNGGRRVKFNFELEDGVVRIRIESEGATGTTATTATTSTTPTTTASTSTSVTSATTTGSALPAGSVTYNVDGAGTVTVVFANGQMTIGAINPAAGWAVEKSEQQTDKIEVELRNGEAEAKLRVRINNGQLEVEIENKN
jgi:hypothetical protein